MPSYSRNFFSLGCILICLSACASTVPAPKTDYSNKAQAPAINNSEIAHANEGEIDLARESDIEKQCLTAWRKCTAGNKKEGINDLKKLSKQYPKSSSVLFMTGQAIEKFGSKKDAIVYYEKAAEDSDFAIMSLYKIAESLRTTGNTDQAVLRYRKLIGIAPQFKEAHLGLAQALKQQDEDSKESISELKKVLELDPGNQQAQAMLNASKKK